MYDSAGKLLASLSTAQRACVFTNARSPFDVRDGGGLAAQGKSWGEANDITTAVGGSNFYNNETATCLGLTLVLAELGVTSLEGTMISGFEVSAWSPAIGHNSMVATNRYITQELEKNARQDKEAAGQRSAPKL